ncbi:recombinase family protein [Vibrio parahaemolyticus]|uniref:recombinase family protein n=1 Tax=Vibrio parahaemolyticus TaxID=670 RepID=UPI0032B786D6
MIIGYARVSTTDQNCDYQIDELTKSGCEKIFIEKASAKTKDRPELTRLLDSLRQDDIVVVYKLDRLGRSLKDLITLGIPLALFVSLNVHRTRHQRRRTRTNENKV